MPERVTLSAAREVSSGRSSRCEPTKDQTRRSVQGHVDVNGIASDARASGAG